MSAHSYDCIVKVQYLSHQNIHHSIDKIRKWREKTCSLCIASSGSINLAQYISRFYKFLNPSITFHPSWIFVPGAHPPDPALRYLAPSRIWLSENFLLCQRARELVMCRWSLSYDISNSPDPQTYNLYSSTTSSFFVVETTRISKVVPIVSHTMPLIWVY